MKFRHVFGPLGTAAVAVGLIVTLANASGAQDASRPFTVPVSVMAGKSEPVSGLTQDNFQLLEDNKEQKISVFLPADSPIGFGVIVDNVPDALKAFQENSNPANEYFVESFGSGGINGAIRDGLGAAERSAKRRKVLVIILDAKDNSSRQSSVDEFAKQDIPIYFVVIDGYPVGASNVLDDIARNTGGSLIYTNDFALKDDLVKLAVQFRSEYLLGFDSSNTAQDGKFRNLKVIVTDPDEKAKRTVQYRSRYFVPKPGKND